MILRYLILLLVCWLPLPSVCRATVFERDWQTPGDGLLTYDDVNQREWLDLTETFLPNFEGNSIESRFQSVAGQLAPGGLFEGFVIAQDNSEILDLAQSAGIDTTTTDPALVNLEATLDLVALLGETTSLGLADGSLTVGYVNDFVELSDGSMPRAGSAFFYFSNSGREGESGLRLGAEFAGNIFTASAGVFLYRNAVPEPTSIFLVLVGTALLLFHRNHT